MSFTAALYEGDSIIRFAPRVRATVKTQGQGTKHVAQPFTTPGKQRIRQGATEKAGRIQIGARARARLWCAIAGATEKAGRFLIGAIWNALRSVILWIDETSREAHYRRIESYLAQSSDHADLERRLRDLERNNRLNWIDCGTR